MRKTLTWWSTPTTCLKIEILKATYSQGPVLSYLSLDLGGTETVSGAMLGDS